MNVSNNPLDDLSELSGPAEVFGTIASIDLTGSRLSEAGLISLCRGIGRSENPFECLILDRCLEDVRDEESDDREEISDRRAANSEIAKEIVKMCDSCPSLRALSFVGTFSARSRWRHLLDLLSGLEKQSSLLELDISDHNLGDPLAFAIGRVFRHNSSLVAFHMDGCHIGDAGFRMIRASLFDNTSLQVRPEDRLRVHLFPFFSFFPSLSLSSPHLISPF